MCLWAFVFLSIIDVWDCNNLFPCKCHQRRWLFNHVLHAVGRWMRNTLRQFKIVAAHLEVHHEKQIKRYVVGILFYFFFSVVLLLLTDQLWIFTAFNYTCLYFPWPHGRIPKFSTGAPIFWNLQEVGNVASNNRAYHCVCFFFLLPNGLEQEKGEKQLMPLHFTSIRRQHPLLSYRWKYWYELFLYSDTRPIIQTKSWRNN